MPRVRSSLVELIIRGKDQATPVLAQERAAMREMESAATQLAAALGAMSAAGAVMTREMVTGAVQLQRVRVGYDNLAASVGESADVMLDQFHAATLSALSDTEAMLNINRFLSMELAKTSEEAAHLAQMAVQLGGAFGKQATQAVEEFTLLLANQSIRRLDTFGMSVAQVRRRMAVLQTGTQNLTREQAFLQAVMEEGERAMERVGSMGDTAGVAFDQFEAATKTLRDELGEYLLPAAADCAKALTDMVKAVRDWPEWAQKATAYTVALGTVVTGIGATALATTLIVMKLSAAWATLAPIVAAVGGVLVAIAAPLAALLVLLDQESSSARTLQGDLFLLEKQVRDLATDYDAYILYMQQATDHMVEWYRSVGVATDEVELMDRGLVLSRYEFEEFKGVLYTVAEAAEESTRVVVNSCGYAGEAFQQVSEQSRMFAEGMKNDWATVWKAAQEGAKIIVSGLQMVQDAYLRLGQTIFAFHQETAMAEEQFAWDREMAQIESMLAQRLALAEHQQAIFNAEAQFQAELLMLQAQGKDEEIANLEISHEEELARIDWRFATAQAQAATAYEYQEAMAEVHYARQEYLQAVAHHAQLEQQLAQFSRESEMWLKRNEALFVAEQNLYALLLYVFGLYATAQMDAETQLAMAHADLEEAKANATIESARAIGEAMYGVVVAYRAALAAAAGNIAQAERDMQEALGRLRNIKIELPPVPDWSAYLPSLGDIDQISEGARRAGRAVADVRSEISDFSSMIRDAIDALIELAGFEAPEGIERAAQQLEDTLRGLIPMLRRLDDTLDAFISRAGMNKIQIFADTISKLAQATDDLIQLAQFTAPGDWQGPFGVLAQVMEDLAWAFEVAQEAWDKYLTIAQIEEIKLFSEAISGMAAAFRDLESIRGMTIGGVDWTRKVQDIADAMEVLARMMAETGGKFTLVELSQMRAFSESVGPAIEAMRGALEIMGDLLIYVPPSESNIRAFMADVERMLVMIRDWARGDLAELADETAVEFANAMDAIFGGMRSVLSAISGIAELGDLADFSYSLQAFNQAVATTLRSWDIWLETMIPEDRLARIADYWTLLGDVFGSMGTAMDAIREIGMPPELGIPATVGVQHHVVLEVRASGFTRIDSAMADLIADALGRKARRQGVAVR